MIQKAFILMVAVSVFTIGARAQAPHGVVYIESNVGNVPGHNSILAFKRDNNGHLYVVTQKALDIMPPDANALHVLKISRLDGTIASETDRVVTPVFPSVPQGVIAR